MSARSIASPTEENFPANGSPVQKLKFALKYAALAPTESDWQPWDFRMADTHLELRAKNEPELDALDPDGRELMIGCGSALLYLKLALKHFGCLGRVALFPDLGEPSLVARVHFGLCRERSPQEKLLFEAMTGNRAQVSPLGGTPVSETMLAALSHSAAGERGWLDFIQSETSRQYVLKVTLTGAQISPMSRMHVDFAAPTSKRLHFTFEPVEQPSVPTATLAIVKTKTDDKHGWVAAGQTMARTVLQAQALGLSWAFFNPVRQRETRAALRMGVGHKGFAQVILRFDPLADREMVHAAAPMTAAAAFQQ